MFSASVPDKVVVLIYSCSRLPSDLSSLSARRITHGGIEHLNMNGGNRCQHGPDEVVSATVIGKRSITEAPVNRLVHTKRCGSMDEMACVLGCVRSILYVLSHVRIRRFYDTF